jgi:hypothetical protein
VEAVSEEPEEDGGLDRRGCGCVLAVPATVVLVVLFTKAPDLGVGLLWVTGWGSLIWAAKRVPREANPAPPPVPERGSKEEPQVGVVRDQSHTNRWLVLRNSVWMTEEITKEAGTT